MDFDSLEDRFVNYLFNNYQGTSRSGRSQFGCWLAKLSLLVILAPVAHLKRSAKQICRSEN